MDAAKALARELLTSKKFVATIIAVALWATGRAGLDLTAEDLALPIGAIIAFILAQGFGADFGKSAAKERAKAAIAATGALLANPDEADTGQLPRQDEDAP